MRHIVVFACVLVGLASCKKSASPIQSDRAGLDTEVKLDPQKFLCALASAPRYTPEARAKARERIAEVLRADGLMPQAHRFMPPTLHGQGVNLYAELRATVPSDTWVVVGSHYDTVTRSPGADDDGSGVTAILMVVEQLSKMPVRHVNVLFVFFDQEEDGDMGSEAFAEQLKSEGRKILAAHCVDMVGYDADGDRNVELAHGPQPVQGTDNMFVELYQRAARRIGGAGQMMRTDLGRSDHESFIKRGYPAVLVAEEYVGDDSTPNYHAPTDTCETIYFPYLRMIANLVASAVAEQIK